LALSQISDFYRSIVDERTSERRKLRVEIFFCRFLTTQICSSFADALQETLGFDWLLLFIQAHLHNTTVVRATRILVTMLSSTPALNRFREGLGSGNWLDGTDVMLNKTTYVVAGMNCSV